NGKDDPPAEPRAGDLKHTHQNDDGDAEADRGKGLRHRAEALISDDGNRKSESQSCADNKQTFHAAILYRFTGTALIAAVSLEKSTRAGRDDQACLAVQVKLRIATMLARSRFRHNRKVPHPFYRMKSEWQLRP